MKVVYTAGPYRDARGPRFIELNIRAAEEVAIQLWQWGYAVICPHANTRHFDGAAPDTVWLEGDLEIIRRVDTMVVLPRWQTSSGTKAEIALAEKLGIPIFYWDSITDRLAAQHFATKEPEAA